MPLIYDHEPHMARLRRAYVVARCQARSRQETFDITWCDWQALWLANDNYLFKGRGANDRVLVRLDHTQSWNMANVQIQRRHDHLSRILSLRHQSRRQLVDNLTSVC